MPRILPPGVEWLAMQEELPPDSTAEAEQFRARRDELLRLQAAMTETLKARPHDYGIRAWWGFVAIGILVGFLRRGSVETVFGYGFAFWIAGLCFSVFVLDSAEVQSKAAIVANKFGARRVASWLYQRALSVRMGDSK